MLNELKTQHREIGRLRFEGLKPAQIADRVGMSVSTIYNILRDPLCKSYMNGLSDKADTRVVNVREKLAEMNGAALEAISDLLDKDTSAPHSVILNAAKDVLDRNGYKAPEQHNHAHAVFTADDLKELTDRANAIDVDYMN